MNAGRAVLVAAIVAHVLGWWLPVADDYRGWQAFRVALSPLWPYEQFRITSGGLLVLSVASALTNVVFVALVVALAGGGAARARLVLYGAAAAALLNLHWPISMGAERDELASGYFVWVISFVLLTLAALLALRAGRR